MNVGAVLEFQKLGGSLLEALKKASQEAMPSEPPPSKRTRRPPAAAAGSPPPEEEEEDETDGGDEDEGDEADEDEDNEDPRPGFGDMLRKGGDLDVTEFVLGMAQEQQVLRRLLKSSKKQIRTLQAQNAQLFGLMADSTALLMKATTLQLEASSGGYDPDLAARLKAAGDAVEPPKPATGGISKKEIKQKLMKAVGEGKITSSQLDTYLSKPVAEIPPDLLR